MASAPSSGGNSVRRLLRTRVFVHGIVSFGDGEGPALAGGMHGADVILLGNIGGSIWQRLSLWRQSSENAGRNDPLDDWSKAIIRPLAETFDATAYFPSAIRRGSRFSDGLCRRKRLRHRRSAS